MDERCSGGPPGFPQGPQPGRTEQAASTRTAIPNGDADGSWGHIQPADWSWAVLERGGRRHLLPSRAALLGAAIRQVAFSRSQRCSEFLTCPRT